MMRLALAVVVVLALAPAHAQSFPEGEYNPFGHSPILIRLDASNDTQGYVDSARAAMRYWERGGNGGLKFDVVFEEVEDASKADIVFWFRDATRVGPICEEEPSALGCARPFDRPVPIEVLIRMEDGTFRSFQQVREVAAHELGHALGLGHSADRSDLMAPHASSRAATTWRPGDLPRLVGGVSIVLALIAGFGYWGWRALRPPKSELGAVHLVEPGSTCPAARDGRHVFEPAVITTRRGEEDWDVCGKCAGGYPARA